MRIIYNIFISVYYYLAPGFLHKKELTLPSDFSGKKNLFLYFDYEREYSGQSSIISNDDVQMILEVLSKSNFKTTWFTVGRIFDKYPESIHAIKNAGHEIGSHTYEHISPLFAGREKLKKDFYFFSESSRKFNSITGFHSPEGQWCISLFPLMLNYGFEYDLTGIGKKLGKNPVKIEIRNQGKIFRLVTIGDDWPLYNVTLSEKVVFNYFVEKFNSLQIGELAGIGCHPWILASDPAIFEGYKAFIRYLSKQSNLRIETARSYINLLMESL